MKLQLSDFFSVYFVKLCNNINWYEKYKNVMKEICESKFNSRIISRYEKCYRLHFFNKKTVIIIFGQIIVT